MFKISHDSQPKTIQEFIDKWKSLDLPSKQIIYDYKIFCKNLLFNSEEIILEVIDLLKKNINLWANQNSSIYKSKFSYISKENLDKKELWYAENFKKEAKKMSTSGSTTGKPFSYLAWKNFFEFIEGENHYDMILDEFAIRQSPNILCFFKNQYDYHKKFIFATKRTDNFLHRHGLKRNPMVHHVNFELYEVNKEEFFLYLFKYIKRNPIDVFFAAGPEINSLCHFIRKYNFKGKIASLLSNSNEILLQTDVDFLFDGNYVDNICDHMRCWDGGATFFTCKYKNYHLCDNLSWSEEIDGKLITTDYFSLPSPFVKYWNGDLCKINDKYERCECGRLYRDFTFVESRPFSLKGLSIEKYKEQIKHSGILSIKQVKCSTNHIEVITNEYISLDEKLKIKNILNKFDVKFSVEKEVDFKENESKSNTINFNINCGSATAECIVDKNDLSGESYVWNMIGKCSGNSNTDDCDCQFSNFVNGTPCVFLGNTTEIPCDCVKKNKLLNNLEIKNDNILFSLAGDCGVSTWECIADPVNPILNPPVWHGTLPCDGAKPGCTCGSGTLENNSCPSIGATTTLACSCIPTMYGASHIPSTGMLMIKPSSPENYSDIVFSLAKCTGMCQYACQYIDGKWQNPTLNFSDCSSGCACEPLTELEQQCASGTVFNKGCF